MSINISNIEKPKVKDLLLAPTAKIKPVGKDHYKSF